MALWRKLNDPNAPHIDVHISDKSEISYDGAWVAVWTDNFDCDNESQYWYCIKDTPFDLGAIKAKRRYEINKGIKNFTTRVINPKDYERELYHVYVESLKGYEGNPVPDSFDKFHNLINAWSYTECCLFGAFDNENNELCGYSDVWIHRLYLPISSLKTIPEYEHQGVNFALIYAICEHFKDDIATGSYLCDGARNSLHKTNFQDFLIKYFEFRRAFCDLHLSYKWFLKPIVYVLFPIRGKLGRIPSLHAILRMEAWSRGLDE